MKAKIFCKYYVEGHANATEAYLKAYVINNRDSARKSASRLMQNPEIQKFIEGLMEESGFNNVAVDMELMKLIRQNDQKSVKLSAIREYTKLMRRGIHDKAAYRREEIEAKVVDDDSLSEEEREQLDQIAIEEAKMHDDNLRRENNELKRELDLIKKKVA